VSSSSSGLLFLHFLHNRRVPILSLTRRDPLCNVRLKSRSSSRFPLYSTVSTLGTACTYKHLWPGGVAPFQAFSLRARAPAAQPSTTHWPLLNCPQRPSSRLLRTLSPSLALVSPPLYTYLCACVYPSRCPASTPVKHVSWSSWRCIRHPDSAPLPHPIDQPIQPLLPPPSLLRQGRHRLFFVLLGRPEQISGPSLDVHRPVKRLSRLTLPIQSPSLGLGCHCVAHLIAIPRWRLLSPPSISPSLCQSLFSPTGRCYLTLVALLVARWAHVRHARRCSARHCCMNTRTTSRSLIPCPLIPTLPNATAVPPLTVR
jgi:hypothetical protein